MTRVLVCGGREFGATFPPKAVEDIFAYDHADVVEGYVDWRAEDPEPGPNRSPGYRWGWANSRRDHSSEPDKLDGLRGEAARILIRQPPLK